MSKITWKNGWGLIQVFENGCLTTKLCHYRFLPAYEGQSYDWHTITYEQYKDIFKAKITIEKLWNKVSGQIRQF